MEMRSMGLEVRALMTITNSSIDSSKRMAMLGRVHKDHFSSDVTKKAFRRISKLAESRGEIVEWIDILEDPNLGEDYRDALEEYDVTPAKTLKGFGKIFDKLDSYRKRRHLLDLAKELHKTLEADDDEFEEDEYIQQVAETLAGARKTSVTEEKVWSFGGKKKGNALKLVKQALYSPKESLYKTGFEEYDRRNGGIPTSGVMLLAGSTSGGKSIISQNLADKMAQLNEIHVLTVTLEMSEEQHVNRQLAMITGSDFSKIKQKKLSDREKKKLYAAAKEYDKRVRKAKGQVSFTSPSRGMSIDDVIYMTVPYAADVCVLDYVGLLEGMDEDNQWRELSAAVRKAKIHSQATGKLYILLVQFDADSNKIRYSKGMKEHADVLWQWNYSDPEVRETGIIPVQIAKVRDGELFEMPLEERFQMMQVGSAPEGTEVPKSKATTLDDMPRKGKKKVNKARAAAKKFLTEDVPDTPNKKKKRKFAMA